MNKIISYLGFAIKSNHIIFGQTPLKHTKEKLHLVLVCLDASENLKNLAKNLAKKHNCCCLNLKVKLEDLTKVSGIKIAGLTDINLAKAIIDNIGNLE